MRNLQDIDKNVNPHIYDELSVIADNLQQSIHKELENEDEEGEFPPPAYTRPIPDPRVRAFLKQLAI